jgi:hypothetical protein
MSFSICSVVTVGLALWALNLDFDFLACLLLSLDEIEEFEEEELLLLWD